MQKPIKIQVYSSSFQQKRFLIPLKLMELVEKLFQRRNFWHKVEDQITAHNVGALISYKHDVSTYYN